MSFESDIGRFTDKLRRRVEATFVGSTEEVQRSIQDGSSITGAPGQPVDTSALRDSWTPRLEIPFLWRTTTNIEYAPAIEEGQQQPYTTSRGTQVIPRPMTLRSKVGGFHSVLKTRTGWVRIVDYVAGRLRI